MLRAVLLDVDFTLFKPGPELGPEGYRRAGERHGLTLDPDRYEDARRAAVASLERHPELEHDEEIWIAFTEAIVRGMGGDDARAPAHARWRSCSEWERHENFFLYDDALPAIAALRSHGLRIGLVSNGQRDLEEFAEHHELDVDVCVGSKHHGHVKPHRSIFEAALAALDVARRPTRSWSATRPRTTSRAPARSACRRCCSTESGAHPEWDGAIHSLAELPAALGLELAGHAGR